MYTSGRNPKTGNRRIPYTPIIIWNIAKNFNGLDILSEYLPANQLPIAKPRMNELIIVETAYTDDPNTRVSGLIQIIS